MMKKVDIKKIRSDLKTVKEEELSTISNINARYGITEYFIYKHVTTLKNYKPYNCYIEHEYFLKKVLKKYLDIYDK